MEALENSHADSEGSKFFTAPAKTFVVTFPQKMLNENETMTEKRLGVCGKDFAAWPRGINDL